MYKVRTQIELFRVIIHGILHLAGYEDRRKTEKAKMIEMEDHYINRYHKKGSDNL